MYSTKVLTTHDKETWHNLLNRIQTQDVNYLPEYLATYEEETGRDSYLHFGGQGLLYVYGDDNNFIVYAFFKRKIADLGLKHEVANDWYDIVSPYGYGGPLANIEDPSLKEELWQSFFCSFDTFCSTNKIISEFTRLNPIFENHIPVSNFSQGIVEKLGSIVYVDLNRSESELFNSQLRGHRRHYRRASENLLDFCIDTDENMVSNFYDIYTQTMRRTGAHEKYYFSRNFFERAQRGLGDAVKFWRVLHKNEVVSGWLVLRHGNLAYAWLSGNKQEYFHLFPTNYLIFNTILQLKKEGCKTFVLGGGKSVSKDSVLRFKEGFSPLKKEYFVYKKIHLAEEYNKLLQLQGVVSESESNYFPKYRLSTEIQSI